MTNPEIGSGKGERSGDQGSGSPPRAANVKSRDSGLSTSRSVSQSTLTDEGPRPPLPPRPVNHSLLGESLNTPGDSSQRLKSLSRPKLQATATTSLSLTDIHTQSYPDGSRETSESTSSWRSPKDFGSIGRFKSRYGSEEDESVSVRSYAPTLEAGGDVESLLGEVLGASSASPAWGLLSTQAERLDPFDFINYDDGELTADFNQEFDELGEIDSEGNNEGSRLSYLWILGIDKVRRRSFSTLEIKAEAFPYTFFRRQTYLQPPW